MAGTLRTVYEIAIRGGTASEAQLRQVGKVGAEAFAKIDAAAATVPKSLRAVDAAASTVRGSIDQLAAKAGPLGAAFSAIGGPVGLIGVATAAAGLGLLAMTKHAIAAGDALADSARKVGMGVEQFQALQYGAKLAGVETQQLEAALKKFGTGVAAAGMGTGALVKTLEVLDPALLGTIQHATNVDQAFTAMAAKIAATKDPFEQVALAVAAFGARSAEAMLPVIVNLESTTARANELGIIMGGSLVGSADAAQDALDTLGLTVKMNLDAALIALAPSIGTAAAELANLTVQAFKFFGLVPELTKVEERLALARKDRDSRAARGADFTLEDQVIADLEKRQAAIQRTATLEAGVAAEKQKQAQLQHELFVQKDKDERAADARRTKGEQAEVAAQHAIEAAQKQAASAADAAAKAAVAAHTKGLETLQDLRDKDTLSGLDAIEAIEAAREISYREWAEQAEAANLTQEQTAEGYERIWSTAFKAVGEERQKEADKQAEVAQREADRLGRIAQRAAERAAEELNRPLNEAFEDIGHVAQGALEAFASGAHVTFEDIATDLKSTIIHALFELAKQQIILSFGAQVTGVGGAGAGTSGGAGGMLQTGQQLLSLGSTLKSGFGMLTDALWGASATTGMLASDVAALSANGITVVGSGTALTAGESAIMFPSGNIPASFGGSAGAGTSTLGGAAATGAIVFAVVAALQSLQVGLDTIRNRKSFYNNDDIIKSIDAGFGPIMGGIGDLISYASTGRSGADLQGSTLRVMQGGTNIQDIVTSSIYAILNPMMFSLTMFMKDLPTKGTVLRKGFEEFLEKDGVGAGFFGRNSGTFQRGVGQTGATNVDLTASQKAVIGGGARGIQSATPGMDFVDAQKEFNRLQQESIGLTDEQMKQVTALGAIFRAEVGSKAGQEETRVFGLIGDFLGSITAEGAGAAETMSLIGEAMAGLGRPALVLEKLNEFFLSPANDIGVQTYRDAIQGLAGALFQDLPQGVDAAALALIELDKAGNGVVTFEAIEKRIKAAVVEAEALGPALSQAFSAGLNDVTLDTIAFSDSVFDDVYAGLREAIAQAAFDGLTAGIFKGDVMGPFLATFQETIAKVKAGELTQGEGNTILATAAKDARDNLETLRPLIEQAVAAGRDLAAVFDVAKDSAEDAAAAIAKAFDASIDRQILGLLSPSLAAQFDLEVTQRERLKAARDVGADLVAVERLNGLERAALMEAQAKDSADQITRIYDQAKQAAERAIKGVKDLYTSLTATTASPLPPEVALANAQANRDSILARAKGGDLAAIEALPEATQAVIDLAQSLFGSTSAFFDIFTPLLADLKSVSGMSPGAVKIPPGDQAIIAQLKTDSAEAMALYQQMLDALLLGPGGEVDSSTGTLAGDQISQQVPDRATAGWYGLGSAEQRSLQGVLADAVPGGDIEKDLVAMLGHDAFDGRYGTLLQSLFQGATSSHGRHAVLEALLGKIRRPDVVSPVLGFDEGGSFRVRDSIPLIPGRVNVSAGETVTVTTHGMDEKLSRLVQEAAQTNAELRLLRREYSAVLGELSQLRVTYQHAQQRPMVPA